MTAQVPMAAIYYNLATGVVTKKIIPTVGYTDGQLGRYKSGQGVIYVPIHQMWNVAAILATKGIAMVAAT